MDLPCNSAAIKEIPVIFPPGLAKLATRPKPTGSPETVTIGISRVAFCAANAQGVYRATRTSTFCATSSIANPGSFDASLSAERMAYSIFCPSIYPFAVGERVREALIDRDRRLPRAAIETRERHLRCGLRRRVKTEQAGTEAGHEQNRNSTHCLPPLILKLATF